jgi:hypothetical protein
MSFNRRLEKLEQRAQEIGESNSNLVQLIIPWPEEYGGPKEYMVTPEYLAALNKIYGKHSQQTNLTA